MADDISRTDRDQGGAEDMRRLFEGAKLLAPPVPEELRSQVRQRGPWAFATRAIVPMNMYRFQPYLLEAVAGPVEDHMAVSHAGHGVNSYAVTYQLVHGPLAVFTQVGWGGVYMDKDKSAAEVREQLRRCAQLVDALAAVKAPAHTRQPSGRLIVVEGTLRRVSICEWLARPLGAEDAAQEWLQQAPRHKSESSDRFPALTEAIRLIRAGHLPPS